MKEMVKDFYECIKNLDGLAYLENYLKYQLASVIQGVKPSVTIAMTENKGLISKWNKYGSHIIKKLNLKYVVLRETMAGKILLIYSTDLIEKVLGQNEVQEFLMEMGYPVHDGEGAVKHLVERYKQYHCPHELGLFLGIPLEDVKDFISCSEKKCMFCGYWKVYNNLESALETFEAYDKAKEKMLNELIEELLA